MVCPSCARPVPEGARFCPSCGSALTLAAPEERRVVTVLFADVVGFTTLAERRDPEQVKRLVDATFERLVADVELFGGSVDKVLGDGIIALFGAPIAHEDDAERAVRAALQMHTTLCDFVAEQDAVDDVRLRIGINTGEVLVGTVAGTDYTAMGDVVNTAARLQALAPPGGVLVGDATKVLCSEALRFEPQEPALLRGREQLERTWLATGVVAPVGARRRRSAVPFVGRVVERSILEAVTANVGAGHGAIVSVVGEPGIGKSRLIDEVLAGFTTTHPDVAVFEGACAPYGEANVWWPLANGLATWFGIDRSDPADVARKVAESRLADPAEVEALLHLLGHPSALDRLDAAGARDALFGAMVSMARRRAERAPIAIWIDDLQWSHTLLRELLEVIARSLAGLPLLIVTAYRAGDEVEWPPPVDRVLTLKLPLGPLGERESAALIEEVVGGHPDPARVERLFERSGGNPLFLTELAMLAADVELPGSLRALIAARLDRLPPDQRAVVDNAAILGAEGTVRALEEFASAMHQHFDPACVDDLVADGLLELEGSWWRFRSDVVREVAYQTLTKQARAQRHAGVATVMASMGKAPIDELAHHSATAAELMKELGQIPGVVPAIHDQAIDLLAQAARRSYDMGGFRRGAALAQRALGLAGDDPAVRGPLLLLHAEGLSEMRSLGAARADLAEVMQYAIDSGDRVAEGEACRLLGTIEQLDGDLVAARTRLGASVEIFREIGDEEQLAESLRARGFAEVMGGSLQDAEWYLGEADAIYERRGDLRGRAWVGQHRAWVSFLSGDSRQAELRLNEAITTFEQLGDHSGVTWARGLLAFVLYFERRFDDAEAMSQDVLAEARRWGDDWGASMMLTLGANLRLWTGRFVESVQYAERALAGFRKLGDRFGMLQALAPLNRARVALGRTADAERGVEEVLALSDSFGNLAFPTIAAAGVAMHLGQGERAVELAAQSIGAMAETGAAVDESRVVLALGHCQAGNPEAALVALLDVDSIDSSPFALAARAIAHAMLGDAPRAIADADAAEAITGASYFDRTLAGIAGAAAAYRSGAPDAGDRLVRVLTFADGCGDVVVAAVARAVARRLGISDGGGEPTILNGWRAVVEALTGVPAR